MIKSIGLDKIILLALIAGFAVGGYFYNTNFLEPSIAKKERQLRSNKSELSKLTSDTQKLISGVELFEKQKSEFETVQQSGFFDDQNRVVTRARLDAMGRESNLEYLRYSISPAKDISNKKLADAGYKILETEILLDVGAIDDTDISTFLHFLNHGFPGQVLIQSMELVRDQTLTQPLLRNIGLKTNYDPLVSGNIKILWKTMVPDTSLEVENEGES